MSTYSTQMHCTNHTMTYFSNHTYSRKIIFYDLIVNRQNTNALQQSHSNLFFQPKTQNNPFWPKCLQTNHKWTEPTTMWLIFPNSPITASSFLVTGTSAARAQMHCTTPYCDLFFHPHLWPHHLPLWPVHLQPEHKCTAPHYTVTNFSIRTYDYIILPCDLYIYSQSTNALHHTIM